MSDKNRTGCPHCFALEKEARVVRCLVGLILLMIFLTFPLPPAIVAG